ncbi:MAG: molybdenum cofactor biosynthesis protein MoaE [Microthrixaceae bacterium]
MSTVPTSDWVALLATELPVHEVHDWLVRDDCGVVVQFSGTTRDHSGERSGVVALTYEAYEAEALARMRAVVGEMRRRWPDAVAVALLHRTGEVPLGGAAVHVGVSAAHRDTAFEAARFGIDALKASVPLWKRETHRGGNDWGLDGTSLTDPAEVRSTWAVPDPSGGTRQLRPTGDAS